MFFFVFTSHVVGSPVMFETMLRSGVPPHIGHSLPPVSPAMRTRELETMVSANAVMAVVFMIESSLSAVRCPLSAVRESAGSRFDSRFTIRDSRSGIRDQGSGIRDYLFL